MKKAEVIKLFTEALEKGEDTGAVRSTVLAAGVPEKEVDKWQKEAENSFAAKADNAAKNADNNKYRNKADELFARYPQAEEFHFTADGSAFFNENDAKNHAKILKSQTLTLVKKQ
jgi:hypothetical protein